MSEGVFDGRRMHAVDERHRMFGIRPALEVLVKADGRSVHVFRATS